MDRCRSKLFKKFLVDPVSNTSFYPKVILQVYLKVTIIFMFDILSSGVWIQSKEIKGSRIADFDCVLLLCFPGYKIVANKSAYCIF